jgi:amino acid transporter
MAHGGCAIACRAAFGYSRTLSYKEISTNGGEMKNPLDSLWGTVISGLVLTLVLYNVVKFALH